MKESKCLLNIDCKNARKHIDLNSIDLIYLDPPFFTQKKQSLSTRDGSKKYEFNDSWENILEYRNYIRDRLIVCRDLLKDSGSIFLHCDSSASHHLRLALEEVFGVDSFQSEIIWAYKRWSNAKKGLLNNHQVIFFYSKTKEFKFNFFYDSYSPSTNVDQIVQLRERDSRNKSTYKKDENGQVKLCTEKKGVPLGDVWDIPYLNPKAKERVGYPTQKPILLLEKIIELVTDEGDVVLDPFCGSGTTLVAAKLLKRKFIGLDISKDAIALAKSRLANPIKTESNLLKKGRDSYKSIDPQVENVISRIGAVPVQRNKGIDGLLQSQNGLIPIKVQKPDETLEEAILKLCKASQKNDYQEKILISLEDSGDFESLNEKGVKVFRNIESLTEVYLQ